MNLQLNLLFRRFVAQSNIGFRILNCQISITSTWGIVLKNTKCLLINHMYLHILHIIKKRTIQKTLIRPKQFYFFPRTNLQQFIKKVYSEWNNGLLLGKPQKKYNYFAAYYSNDFFAQKYYVTALKMIPQRYPRTLKNSREI